MSFIVAIDGPAGTGKGTITKILSEKLNLINIDTGAMYRCVALECLRQNISPNEENEVNKALKSIDIKLLNNDNKQRVLLNNEDVSEEIREPKVDSVVAKYAALKCVRDSLTLIQQKMGIDGRIIMEGRDIGTVVFPNADVKIYLDCEVHERARRRYLQNLEKGINDDYEKVLHDIEERNTLETKRKIAPLTKADDAILIDSTNMTIEEVCKEIESIIKRKNGLYVK